MIEPRTAHSRPRRPSSRISLRAILITAFTARVIGAGASVGLLALHASRQAVSSMAEQLMADIGDRIDERLAAQLAQLRRVVQTNAALIRRGRLDWRDGPAIEQHFAEQLGLFSGVTTIAEANEQREFRLMVRAGHDERTLRRMDASTGFRLDRYRADWRANPANCSRRGTMTIRTTTRRASLATRVRLEEVLAQRTEPQGLGSVHRGPEGG